MPQRSPRKEDQAAPASVHDDSTDEIEVPVHANEAQNRGNVQIEVPVSVNEAQSTADVRVNRSNRYESRRIPLRVTMKRWIFGTLLFALALCTCGTSGGTSKTFTGGECFMYHGSDSIDYYQKPKIKCLAAHVRVLDETEGAGGFARCNELEDIYDEDDSSVCIQSQTNLVYCDRGDPVNDLPFISCHPGTPWMCAHGGAVALEDDASGLFGNQGTKRWLYIGVFPPCIGEALTVLGNTWSFV